MAGLTFRGVHANLVWGYHPVGTVRDWSVARDDFGWHATATIVSVDAFKASQRPLTLVAPHAHGAWRWPITELAMTAGTLTARLGPRESPHVEVRPA